MRKCAAIILLLFCVIAEATLAYAAEQEFGPAYGRFMIEVPDGWNTQDVNSGVQVVSPDGQSSVTASVIRCGGMPPGQVATIFASTVDSNAEVKQIDATHYTITGKDGIVTNLAFHLGGVCISVTSLGDAVALPDIVKSIRLR